MTKPKSDNPDSTRQRQVWPEGRQIRRALDVLARYGVEVSMRCAACAQAGQIEAAMLVADRDEKTYDVRFSCGCKERVLEGVWR